MNINKSNALIRVVSSLSIVTRAMIFSISIYLVLHPHLDHPKLLPAYLHTHSISSINYIPYASFQHHPHIHKTPQHQAHTLSLLPTPLLTYNTPSMTCTHYVCFQHPPHTFCLLLTRPHSLRLLSATIYKLKQSLRAWFDKFNIVITWHDLKWIPY